MKQILPFLAIIILASCSNVKNPQFRRVENFRIISPGFQESRIGFNVTCYNPNNFGVTIKEGEADFYVDSVYLGKFNQDSTISVNDNAEFSIPLKGNVAMKTFLKLNYKDIGSRDIILKVDGNIKVGKAGIFVSKPVQYTGKHRIGDIKF